MYNYDRMIFFFVQKFAIPAANKEETKVKLIVHKLNLASN